MDLQTVQLGMSPEEVRSKMMEFEKALSEHSTAEFGDDAAPLKHTFVDGAYVREITMPAGMILTSKIHKIEHPYFVMKGDCSVMTDDKMVRIKAPYWGVTMPNTKRILYIHEETVWVTVHVTDSKDLDEIEHQIISPSFENIIAEDKEGEKI